MTGCFIDSGLDHGIFLNSDISQGRVFHGYHELRCGEIISQGFVANLLVNMPVKEVWKSVNIWRSYGQYCSALFFWLSVFACSFSVDLWKWHQQICKITTHGIRGTPWENVQLTAQKDVIVNSFDLKFVNKVRVFSLLSFAWLWSPYEIGQTIIFLPCSFFPSFYHLLFFLA